MKTLTAVYVSLLVFLILTVAVSFWPLGAWSSALSLLIALAKAALILLFFMKLHESAHSLRLVALASILWIIFLFILTSVDYLTRGTAGILGK
jgi:cytochrome c oxidase subunit IV